MGKLGINVDHVATLRQARKTNYPDPVAAAVLAELGGADNITCHLREDRRHVQDRDVRILRETISTSLNLEMAATSEMVRIALEIKPNVVTLVPEKREELTTEGGLDLATHGEMIAKSIGLLRESGIQISLFVNPDPDAIKIAHRFGAQAVEIHTGAYSQAHKAADILRELGRIQEAVSFATKLRLHVHAGHGLHYQNIDPLARMKSIDSFQIGHAIIARACYVGMEAATREMKSRIDRNPSIA